MPCAQYAKLFRQEKAGGAASGGGWFVCINELTELKVAA